MKNLLRYGCELIQEASDDESGINTNYKKLESLIKENPHLIASYDIQTKNSLLFTAIQEESIEFVKLIKFYAEDKDLTAVVDNGSSPLSDVAMRNMIHNLDRFGQDAIETDNSLQIFKSVGELGGRLSKGLVLELEQDIAGANSLIKNAVEYDSVLKEKDALFSKASTAKEKGFYNKLKQKIENFRVHLLALKDSADSDGPDALKNQKKGRKDKV
ncbi:hypothetical protein DR64_1625 [Paraburkholderia xenovorans LB400]|jgi:hypothetical protein|uniref:Uncharacterized protein n=1 Tax=Paraburkholderia xenovorans (strain LB400) TaxID=266265 RepID=Q145E0_PARXL|nr:hypothetical protein [Paraburkholderia xenovorans]ABE29049.1 hypothetical protein Bxe_A3950 [Paraburkholderia xenovorans LB400]AIP32580.1 hypothetical protein DR64_1625 [Paraburkholderia xenovorans LB400]